MNLVLKKLKEDYRIDEYSFHHDIKTIQHHFKKNIDSHTAQKLATYLWQSYEKLIYENGEKVHFKRFDALNSLEGKSNRAGIRYKNKKIIWNKLEIPVNINEKSDYEQESLLNDIAYCRIIRKFIKNRYKFYVQIVFKGVPPIKTTQNGDIKHPIGSGDVGLDIGVQTIAISSLSDVKIYELAPKVQNIEKIKHKLLRKLDRSKRTMNQDNFNADGTIKKHGSKKVVWIKSNKYTKIQNKLKELYRKQADIRKYSHECLANDVIKQGDRILVETMNFKGLQRRAKETTINEKTGKINRKKRFGKSLGNKAPAKLIEIIARKLRYQSIELLKIDTWSVKASQYNHEEESYTKKKLSERWTEINNTKVQRDMYSAFLIMNVNDDKKSISKEKCDKRYNNFLELHNIEVSRLQGQKNLSSIAI